MSENVHSWLRLGYQTPVVGRVLVTFRVVSVEIQKTKISPTEIAARAILTKKDDPKVVLEVIPLGRCPGNPEGGKIYITLACVADYFVCWLPFSQCWLRLGYLILS